MRCLTMSISRGCAEDTLRIGTQKRGINPLCFNNFDRKLAKKF